MSEIVERAKAALEGVTPGPWRRLHSCNDIHAPAVQVLVFSHDPAPLLEDAEFIAQARTLVPELIAELERHHAFVQAIVETSDRGICPVCSYLWDECECGVVDQ